MKPIYWAIAIGVGLLGLLAVIDKPDPITTDLPAEGLSISAPERETVIITVTPDRAITVGTTMPEAKGPPLRMYFAYLLAGGFLVFAVNLMKDALKLSGRILVLSILGVFAVTGWVITVAFSQPFFSNPLNIMSSIAIVALGAYVIYELFVKRRSL